MSIGKLHVVLVHLPIGLAVATVAADFLWLATRRLFFKNASLYCLIGALITAIPTVITGWLLLNSMTFLGETAKLADNHQDMGFTTLGIIAAAFVCRLLWVKWQKKPLIVIYGLLIAALLVSISITGDLGGKIVYGKNFLSNVFSQRSFKTSEAHWNSTAISPAKAQLPNIFGAKPVKVRMEKLDVIG